MRRTAFPLGLFLLVATRGAAADGPPPGEWKVTELTGSITTTYGGLRPPEGICTEQGEETASAVVDGEDTFVELDLPPRLSSVSLDYGLIDEYEDEISRWSRDPRPLPLPGLGGRATHYFTFSFGFDNGYHSNAALDVGAELTLDLPEDPERQDLVLRLLFGELPNPLPGLQGSYYAGRAKWNAESSTGKVVGGAVLTQEGFGVGLSRFIVLGLFDGPRKLSGNWTYEERSQAFGCTTTAKGEGTWAAEPMP